LVAERNALQARLERKSEELKAAGIELTRYKQELEKIKRIARHPDQSDEMNPFAPPKKKQNLHGFTPLSSKY
jgi:hypothetical protein